MQFSLLHDTKCRLGLCVWVISLFVQGVASVTAQTFIPPLNFEEENYLSAPKRQGTQFNHVFRFQNLRQKAIRIKQIVASCGCTTALPSSWMIERGAKGDLTTWFDTDKLKGDTEVDITIITDDQQVPAQTIKVRIPVIPEYRLSETGIEMDAEGIGGAGRFVTLTPVAAENVIIRRAYSHPDYLTVECKQHDNGKLGISIRPRPRLPQGTHQVEVVLETDNFIQPKIMLPVKVNVKGPYQVKPSNLFFGFLSPGSNVSRSVSIRRLDGAPFSISRAIAEQKTVLLHLNKLGNVPHAYNIRASVEGTRKNLAALSSEVIAIYADGIDRPVIRIPVLASLQAQSSDVHIIRWYPDWTARTSIAPLASIMAWQGYSLDEERFLNVARMYGGKEPSLATFKEAASKLGIRMLGVRTTLEDLVKLHQYALVETKNSNRSVVLLDATAKQVRYDDGSMIHVVEASHFKTKFTGNALLIDLERKPIHHGGVEIAEPDFVYTVHNFDDPVDHEFLIRNTGPSDITIDEILGSCGCIAVGSPEKVIKPGKFVKIRIRLAPKLGLGFNQSIRIHTNDVYKPFSLLTLRGAITGRRQ